jgi:nucleotide-binding universal stress UspA family protein
MMKILVAYDGSLNSQTALKYGIRKVKEVGGGLFVVHVFNSSMFIDYGAGPRAEEMARRESAGFVEDARRIISETATDIDTKLITVEGNPKDEIVNFAGAEMMDLVIVPPRYKAIVKNSPCPVSIIPGNIVLPVDNTDSYLKVLDRAVEEATETASKVIVLGIVPIHLYSKGEKKEVEGLRKETEASVKKVKTLLNKNGVETKEIMRSGYPDEEIVKVTDEYPVAMIIISESGDTPSELGKAANIIIDDSERLKKPVFLVAPEKAT